MKNKPLLLWGLGAGIIALVVFIVGYAFVWPVDDDEGCRMTSDGKCGMMKDGDGGMMGDDGCGMMKMMEGMMGEDGMMGEGGMMGMMGNMMSGGMMGGPVDAATAPISIDQAADAARKYVTDQGNSDLKASAINEFTNGFYVRVGEVSTGTGAYELKVDRNSGTVSRSMGPGMMWNKKYKGGMMDMMSGMGDMSGMMEMMGGMEGMMGEDGMMGCMKGDDEDDEDDGDDNGMEGMDHGSMSGGDMNGMDSGNMDGMEGMDHGSMSGDDMSGSGNMNGMEGMSGMMDMMGSVDNKATTADMTIKPADAGSRAQKYADTQFPGSSISKPVMFYGYYTVDIIKDGRVLALLSVNGYSGQVWVQAWPGSYLGGKAL